MLFDQIDLKRGDVQDSYWLKVEPRRRDVGIVDQIDLKEKDVREEGALDDTRPTWNGFQRLSWHYRQVYKDPIVMYHIHCTMFIKCITKSSPRSLRNISPVFSTGVFYRFEITKSSHLCCVVINLLFCNQFRQVHYIFSGTNFFTICILHCLVVYQFCQDFPIFRGTEDNGGNSLGGEASSMTWAFLADLKRVDTYNLNNYNEPT